MEARAAASSELRPLSIGETLDVSIKVYLRHAGSLFRIVATIVVPLAVLGALVNMSLLEDARLLRPTLSPAQPAPGDLFPGGAGWLAATMVLGIVQAFAYLLALAACFKAVGEGYLGGRPEWIDSLRFAGRRLGSLLLAALMVLAALFIDLFVVGILGVTLAIPFTLAGPAGAVAAVVVFVLLAVPGVGWLATYWSVFIPALLAEDAGSAGSLGRSWSLVKGRFWATFATLLVGLLLATLVQVLVGGALIALLFTNAGESVILAATLNTLATAVGSVVTIPLIASLIAIIYFDLRVRKEGLDLRLVARGMTAPGPQGPSGPTPTPTPAPAPAGDPYGGPARAGGSTPPPPPRPTRP